MASNEIIAEKLNQLMHYHRSRRNSEKAAAFSVASTQIRDMKRPVAGMKASELSEELDFDEIVIQKIREFVEKGKLSEFEK